MRRFVLASASPARLRLLRDAGLDPEVVVSGVDEAAFTAPTPGLLVLALANAKADAVAQGVADALVLGCDSLLAVGGTGYGKPGTAPAALARWRALRGTEGELITGHALLDVRAGKVVGRTGATRGTIVRFGSPTDREIEAYVASGEPLGVAGAFTLDALGAWFVDGIDGDPSNVLGLSLPLLRGLLSELGLSPVDLWRS